MVKNSRILRAARGRIASKRNWHICHAIRDTHCGSSKQKIRLRKWVMNMMDGSFTYEGWLNRHHTEVYQIMSEAHYRQGRLQWLDWMIAECEKAEAADGN
jgi:hypothetical protein